MPKLVGAIIAGFGLFGSLALMVTLSFSLSLSRSLSLILLPTLPLFLFVYRSVSLFSPFLSFSFFPSSSVVSPSFFFISSFFLPLSLCLWLPPSLPPCLPPASLPASLPTCFPPSLYLVRSRFCARCLFPSLSLARYPSLSLCFLFALSLFSFCSLFLIIRLEGDPAILSLVICRFPVIVDTHTRIHALSLSLARALSISLTHTTCSHPKPSSEVCIAYV